MFPKAHIHRFPPLFVYTTTPFVASKSHLTQIGEEKQRSGRSPISYFKPLTGAKRRILSCIDRREARNLREVSVSESFSPPFRILPRILPSPSLPPSPLLYAPLRAC